MTCPQCGDDDRIDIAATVYVRLGLDGTDVAETENGDHEWDDDSTAVCNACGHTGTVRSFNTAAPTSKGRYSWAQTALDAYTAAKGEQPDEADIVDLLADLMHLCWQKSPMAFNQAMATAQMHFDCEIQGRGQS
jgi:hypothetical protein